MTRAVRWRRSGSRRGRRAVSQSEEESFFSKYEPRVIERQTNANRQGARVPAKDARKIARVHRAPTHRADASMEDARVSSSQPRASREAHCVNA